MVNSPSSPCGDLFQMRNGDTCTAKWYTLRDLLHPAQAAVGFAAVKRKHDKDYKTEKKAQTRMDQPGSALPFVLGPNGIPYLVDSHHTISALEASGHHSVNVTLKKICDWSHMTKDDFYRSMKRENFMNGTDRIDSEKNPNAKPVRVDVAKAIPDKIPALKDDPWRSLAALVRKVKDKDHCPPGNYDCLRGYFRECRDDGGMTAFFEFRWAYFMNDAYNQGCASHETSYWDDLSDCRRFRDAYEALLQTNVGAPILEQDAKAWQKAAKLLVPLCRGTRAQTYQLPAGLGSPMGGETLPGRVSGKDTQIREKDPSCAAPKCPDIPAGFQSAPKK